MLFGASCYKVVTASPEQGFEILNKIQLDFICPGLDFVS